MKPLAKYKSFRLRRLQRNKQLLTRWFARRRGGIPVLAALAILSFAMNLALFPSSSHAARFSLKRLIPAEKLSRPLYLAEVPDGTGRLVVVEQTGLVKVFAPGSTRAEAVMLDLTETISLDGWEEGLLSLAFHPAFARNRQLFVYYSAADPRRSVVMRLTLQPRRLVLLPGSEREILTVRQPFSNHNGGLLLFGPKGYLHIGLGDGGAGGDPHGNGQNRRTLLGSMLRIDVNRPSGGRAYGIPADNPFASAKDGTRPEIWAYGLRNPWRYSFDRQTGSLIVADVGQDAIEEINIVVKGGNYGWNRMEGTRCFQPTQGCRTPGLRLPAAEYTHRDGRSITGGFVYRGRTLPALRDRYVFADFISGTIWSIPVSGGAMGERTTELRTSLAISSFAEDAQGELYLLDLKGGVYRLAPTP